MMTRLMIALVVAFALPASAQERSQEKPTDKSIAARIAGLQRLDGYVPLYWDAAAGKMLLEISRFNTEFLYQISLSTGVGSNPLGLDRGQLGREHVVRFERIGPRVLLTESNYRYRAISSDPAERRAVEESFAQSVLWGFKVEASEGNRVLVDATAFFLRDAHGVIDRLRQARQGQYRLDESRVLPSAHEGFSKEHRSRNRFDVFIRRRPRTNGARDRSISPVDNRTRAPFTRRTPRQKLQTSRPRSARRGVRDNVLRFCIASQ
jgi:hypothetical protein